jgi:hypothetical protein
MSLLKDAALKMIKTLISPEQIREITADLLAKAIEEKNKIELDSLNNEADAVAIFYEMAGQAHFAIAILSPEEQIIRFENVQTVAALVETLINNI